MFSSYQENQSDINSTAMEIESVSGDVEMKDNPASKINISFECIEKGQDKIEFFLHFQTEDTSLETVNAANQLLDYLLTPDFRRGLFSERDRENKFRKAQYSSYDTRLGYYFSSRYRKENEGVFNNIADNGKATIAFGNVPCYCCPDDTPGALLVMLSMLDDSIQVMKKLNYNINFTVFDIIKKLALSYASNREKFGKNNRPDNNPHTLQQLITLIEKHPTLAYNDAILLCYAFSLVDRDHFLGHIEMYLQQDHTIDFVKLIDSTCTWMMGNKYWKDSKLSQQVNFVIDRLNLCNKIKLFTPALGSEASDGGLYSWSYTEWQFLRDADFKLNDNRKMIIDVIKENTRSCTGYNNPSGYMKHYAPGKDCHAIFSQEMKALETNTNTGLEFEPESDTQSMHDKIICTRLCSEKLITMQIHNDINNLKQAIKTRNNLRFFEQSSPAGFLKENLPPEIVSKINSFVFFKVENRKLSAQEIKEQAEEWENSHGRW